MDKGEDMIKKEYYKTREDGVELYRTYSDTDHLIKKISDGITYGDAIDISENEEYEEVGEYIELEGPGTYEEIRELANSAAVITRKINRIGLTDNEALSVKELYPWWENKIDCTIEAGFITFHEAPGQQDLPCLRQDHRWLLLHDYSLDSCGHNRIPRDDPHRIRPSHLCCRLQLPSCRDVRHK